MCGGGTVPPLWSVLCLPGTLRLFVCVFEWVCLSVCLFEWVCGCVGGCVCVCA